MQFELRDRFKCQRRSRYYSVLYSIFSKDVYRCRGTEVSVWERICICSPKDGFHRTEYKVSDEFQLKMERIYFINQIAIEVSLSFLR